MDISVEEIARIVGGAVLGDGALRITGLNGLPEAGDGDLAFYHDPRYRKFLDSTRAAAVLVPETEASDSRTLIRVADPYAAFAAMLKRLQKETLVHPTGIHPSASVAEDAVLGRDVAIGANACVEAGATIGDRAVLYAGVYIGRHSRVGPETILYPNVVVREHCDIGARCVLHANASIGADGFGYTTADTQVTKIPQAGVVLIGDDVEIGANSSVDRATCGSTRIGDGTKIDSQVQIGHNAQIGRHCVICGCAGIAGSARIGDHVTVGGMGGVGGHIDVGDHVTIGGRGGVTRPVAPGSVVSGFPAADHKLMLRYYATRLRLPEALKRIRALEKRLDELERG